MKGTFSERPKKPRKPPAPAVKDDDPERKKAKKNANKIDGRLGIGFDGVHGMSQFNTAAMLSNLQGIENISW